MADAAFVFQALPCFMSLSEQLLSFGYAHGDGRIGILVNFLRSHEIEKLEDVIGCPTLLGLTGIEVLHDDDLAFVQKAAPAYVCACILFVQWFVQRQSLP